MKPLVYIASPYTKGDVGINTRFQCQIWNDMMNDGRVLPYAPLWSHFQHTMFPRPYEDWIEYDNAIIPRMDALVRLSAEYMPLGYFEDKSSGADAEVELARSHGLPVFFTLHTLYLWVNAGCPRGAQTTLQH